MTTTWLHCRDRRHRDPARPGCERRPATGELSTGHPAGTEPLAHTELPAQPARRDPIRRRFAKDDCVYGDSQPWRSRCSTSTTVRTGSWLRTGCARRWSRSADPMSRSVISGWRPRGGRAHRLRRITHDPPRRRGSLRRPRRSRRVRLPFLRWRGGADGRSTPGSTGQMTPGPVPSGASREGPTPGRWAGLAIAGVALCCGLPVLLAAGSTFTVLGLGLGSWVLLTAGIVAALAGGLALRSKRRRCETGSNTAEDV